MQVSIKASKSKQKWKKKEKWWSQNWRQPSKRKSRKMGKDEMDLRNFESAESNPRPLGSEANYDPRQSDRSDSDY